MRDDEKSNFADTVRRLLRVTKPEMDEEERKHKEALEAKRTSKPR